MTPLVRRWLLSPSQRHQLTSPRAAAESPRERLRGLPGALPHHQVYIAIKNVQEGEQLA
jgi:hypothetical protein